MVRCLASDKLKQWDIVLPQEEFASNSMLNRRKKCPFAIVYTKVPNYLVDLFVMGLSSNITLPHWASNTIIIKSI